MSWLLSSSTTAENGPWTTFNCWPGCTMFGGRDAVDLRQELPRHVVLLGDRLQRVARVDRVRRFEPMLGRVDDRAGQLAQQQLDLLCFGGRERGVAVPTREHFVGGDEFLPLERILNLRPLGGERRRLRV